MKTHGTCTLSLSPASIFFPLLCGGEDTGEGKQGTGIAVNGMRD